MAAVTEDELRRVEQVARAADPMFRAMWGAMWPKGCCVPASLAFAPLLRMSTLIHFRVAIGHQHVWLESPESDVVDLTYGQFSDSQPWPGSGWNDPLLIVPAGQARPPQLEPPFKLLTLRQEQKYRGRIRARGTGEQGWFPTACGIRQDFGWWPSQR